MIHDNKGGLEKYPKSRFVDHNQYCASSPNKSKFVEYIDMNLTINNNKHETNKKLYILTILIKIVFHLKIIA